MWKWHPELPFFLDIFDDPQLDHPATRRSFGSASKPLRYHN